MHTCSIDKDGPSVILTQIITHFHPDMKTERAGSAPLVCSHENRSSLNSGPVSPSSDLWTEISFVH